MAFRNTSEIHLFIHLYKHLVKTYYVPSSLGGFRNVYIIRYALCLKDTRRDKIDKKQNSVHPIWICNCSWDPGKGHKHDIWWHERKQVIFFSTSFWMAMWMWVCTSKISIHTRWIFDYLLYAKWDSQYLTHTSKLNSMH